METKENIINKYHTALATITYIHLLSILDLYPDGYLVLLYKSRTIPKWILRILHKFISPKQLKIIYHQSSMVIIYKSPGNFYIAAAYAYRNSIYKIRNNNKNVFFSYGGNCISEYKLYNINNIDFIDCLLYLASTLNSDIIIVDVANDECKHCYACVLNNLSTEIIVRNDERRNITRLTGIIDSNYIISKPNCMEFIY